MHASFNEKGMKSLCLKLLAGASLMVSCADQYMVNGTSSVQALEGKTLYLKVFQDDDMHIIDSARVVHGRFPFSGVMDSITMANVFLENTSVMPLVLEDGRVEMKIGEITQSATGTPLNDSLSRFIMRKTQIDAQMAELPHRESQMIMDGMDHDLILRRLSQEARELSEQNDRLVTRFIISNYNNVLGPGIFMILTNSLEYPILNPQIEEILSDAPPYFLNNPYVKEYIKAAEANMKKIHEY